MAAHGEMLRSRDVPEAQIDLIAVDHRRAGLSSRDAALLDFGLKLSRTPARISRADVDRLRGLGFSDDQLLEANPEGLETRGAAGRHLSPVASRTFARLSNDDET